VPSFIGQVKPAGSCGGGQGQVAGGGQGMCVFPSPHPNSSTSSFENSMVPSVTTTVMAGPSVDLPHFNCRGEAGTGERGGAPRDSNQVHMGGDHTLGVPRQHITTMCMWVCIKYKHPLHGPNTHGSATQQHAHEATRPVHPPHHRV
jgi:hypothetical protein